MHPSLLPSSSSFQQLLTDRGKYKKTGIRRMKRSEEENYRRASIMNWGEKGWGRERITFLHHIHLPHIEGQ